jgi:hypothetical protein
MVLQAKALTTAAEWAQAYAELVKEKDALAKEKDALTSVTKEKDAQLSVLTKENRILTSEKDALASGLAAVAKEKDALAKQLSQCTARGSSIGLLCTLVALVCEALSRRAAHSFCAHRCMRDVCSCSGGRRRRRDAAEASSRSRCRARAETRAPFELDRVHGATCHILDSCSEPSPHGVRARAAARSAMARRSYEEASRRRASPSSAAATRSALSAADRPSRYERSAVPSVLAAFESQPIHAVRVAACPEACGTQRRAPCTMATCRQHAPCRPRIMPKQTRRAAYSTRAPVLHAAHAVRCAIVAGGPPAHSHRRLPARSSSSRSLLQTARTPPPLPSLLLSLLACANRATRSPHPAAACAPLSFSVPGRAVLRRAMHGMARRHELRRQRYRRLAAAHDRHSDRARPTAHRVHVHGDLRGRAHAHTRRAVLRLGEQRSEPGHTPHLRRLRG